MQKVDERFRRLRKIFGGVSNVEKERLWRKEGDFVALQVEVWMWWRIGEDIVGFSGTGNGG